MSPYDDSAARLHDDAAAADGNDRRTDAAERPPRLLDRIAEAVRAAHDASVPF